MKKIIRKKALEITHEILTNTEKERSVISEIPTCKAFTKYSKDRWRLMYILHPQQAEEEMNTACSEVIFSCPHQCGRWREERIANIKKLAGIVPFDKNMESLRVMLDKIRNMGQYEYEKLFNSLPEEDK
jgi:hypothetical protein